MPNLRKVEPQVPALAPRKKVAAYCRVSKDTEGLLHSFSAQVSHYSSLIQSNPEWQYAGVYSDEGISGTRIEKREGFQRMIADADEGKIDIILAKSISRFARNTVDTLTAVRHLKDIGVEVRFERENISTFSADGELMLTLLASFAQEESVSMSENIKWSRRKCFEQGDPQTRTRLFGYRWDGDLLVTVPDEAETVRRIYGEYLDGYSSRQIAARLNADGCRTIRGAEFDDGAVLYILKNVTYTGDLLLQKTVMVDPLKKKRLYNNGEFAQYLVEGDHETIIDRETFDRVQALLTERANKGWGHNRYTDTTCFYQKIVCGKCGYYFVHGGGKCKDGSTSSCFYCGCRSRRLPSCGNCQILERTLRVKIAEALETPRFDESVFLEKVDHVEVLRDAPLKIFMKDGRVIEKMWKARVRYAEGNDNTADEG